MANRRFVPLNRKPLVWVDTETTGLDPDINDVIEMAIIRIEADGSEKVLHAFIKMERPGNAHPKALAVNGYSDEKWVHAEDPSTFWPQIAKDGWFHEAIVAGQNVKFDVGFINASFKRHGIDVRTDYHIYDTCSLAIEHLYPWVESISLVPICVALGIPVENAHTAMADVRMAMAVEAKLARATDADREEWRILIPERVHSWKHAGRPNVWPPLGGPAGI